ncbi:MAG: hypothetical protein WC380_00050 [Pedobacter sp.]|jgi:hypothetical protein
MITKEELLEIGFIELDENDFTFGKKNKINVYDDELSVVDIFVAGHWIEVPNATTIQDIEDLIRLFNFEK